MRERPHHRVRARVQIATEFAWGDVREALIVNKGRIVRKAAGGQALYSSTYEGTEPPPFSAKTLNPRSEWGVGSKAGVWCQPPDRSKPLFKTRVT